MTQRMIDIVRKHLIDNCYVGLYHPETGCGCALSDLIRCGDNCMDCFPARLRVCANGKDLEVYVEDSDERR